MLDNDELTAAVAALPRSSLEGVVFRVIQLQYVGSPLSSRGSLKGGRYNPPNQLEALYLADTPVNCLLEVEALIQTEREFSGVSKSPQVMLSIEYKLNSVIDIVDAGAQTTLKTNVQELTGSWRFMNAQGQLAPTQNLGEVVYSMQQVEALKVPSAKVANAYNLVVFPARLSGDSFLRVVDDSGTINSQITSAIL